MAGGFWTDENTARLKVLVAEGHSAEAIRVIIGHKSRSAIIGKVHRVGLSLAKSQGKKAAKAKPVRRAPIRVKPVSPLRRALEMAPEPMPFAIVEEVVVPEKERVGVEGLGEHQCRWPINDPQSTDFHFCHHKRIGGISYCEIHARRAYRPIEQQPREIRRSFANDNARAPVRETENV